MVKASITPPRQNHRRLALLVLSLSVHGDLNPGIAARHVCYLRPGEKTRKLNAFLILPDLRVFIHIIMNTENRLDINHMQKSKLVIQWNLFTIQ